MDNRKTLLTYHDLTVEVEYTPGQELKDHLAGTTLGTPGGFRYRHEGLDDRLESAEEQYFLYLRKSGNMLGSVGFVWRNLTSAGLTHDCWLIRYFSIKAPMRSAPYGMQGKRLQEEGKSDSVLGRFMKPVMDEPSRLRQQPQEQEAAIIYALIESKNLRSLNFSRQMGLAPVADIANFTFSRMKPRLSARVGQIVPEEIPEMQSRLREFYADYALYYPDPLFKDQDYYVIRDDRGIVAGAQIYRVTWKIVDFGSPLANRGLRLLARLGFVRKRLNPDALRFWFMTDSISQRAVKTNCMNCWRGSWRWKNHTWAC
ncbi:MAG: hypothetical protein R2751_02645 [Bacteroidales bacterium]